MAVSRQDWACAGLIVLGIILFLYGSKYYDNLVGWLGVFLVVGGLLALILLYVYNALSRLKGPTPLQNP
jgi:drug/metabolite transporter (DMT)-like permease